MSYASDTPADSAQQLQRAALVTSAAVLQRQRRVAHELAQAQAALKALTQAQAQALSLLHSTLEASPDAVGAYDLSDRLIAYNQSYLQLWQLSPEMIETTDPSVLRLHLESQVTTPERLTMWSDDVYGPCVEVTRVDGRLMERRARPQMLHGSQVGVVFHWRDITGRRRDETQRQRLTHFLERSVNEIYLFDPVNLKFEYANAGALRNLGYDLPTLRRMTPVDLAPDFDETQLRQLLEPLLQGSTELLVFETVHQRADQSLYNVQINLQSDNSGERPLLMALVLDITERKRSEALIWNQAHFDVLTQLPNRVMLQESLSQEIAKAQRNSQKLAVLFIDLDKFKEVNDMLGHAQGDQLLRQASQRIRTCVRASDSVARMGGDEFVVLLSELQDGRMASDVAQALIDQLTLPFALDAGEVVVSGSIGITLYPDDAQSSEVLLKNADQAMYLSKTRGRNQFSYFTRELEQSAQRRMHMIAQLRQALVLGQFEVHFQPIVDMADGQIHKAEALIRWNHPVLGAVSPVEFIPLAEESGLIVPIGDWVFDEAVRWVKRWRETQRRDFQVSVNKSPVQFQREKGFTGTWQNKLHEQGLPGNCITMEITEGLLIDANTDVQTILKNCREAGIEVAIDDFGTGYSSLAYLKRFEVDYVKIDRSFVSNLAPGSSDLALTQAIIAMAHALKLKVIAEGVETAEQRDLLKQAGCDYAQGYLFARPMPPADLENLLSALPSA
ncbi:bifunctional diguanylate cyclase/phosphodiesterase [Rhodoferax sp. PAMC 29310]|uniref:putative bifunctional diguanylate cyclase/phosphodiesterase n=1 Tax=Rhodoferax sp. PAMC 29310 TaxID=2822760 RepID=UPI001B331273|nr:bifunctional diguanylate cyclase/phosphodiesterase [Rhodoferax sp. PAMC 29310]